MREYFLKTPRMEFSKWRREDLKLAISLWGDEKVTCFICADGKFTMQEIEQRLDREIENEKRFGIQYWPVFCMTDEDFIGCCGLRPFSLKDNIYEIGFHLREKYWGQGLAAEGAEAVIRYAEEHLKAKKIFAGHNPDNEGSKRVLNKLGFHYIGDKFYEPTGLYHPSYEYPL